MSDSSLRIAHLSPAKCLLFQRLLANKTLAADVQKKGAQPDVPAGFASILSGIRSTGQASVRTLQPADIELAFEANSAPAEIKASYRRFYNAVSEQLDSTEFGEFSFFLNYGYVADRNPQYAQVKLPDYFLNKNSVALALELLGDCIITGGRVLDVGCGRGGTVYVIHRFFSASQIIGIDLSSTAISFCKNTHKYPRVGFLEGDAEDLPLRDESFDIVTNLESSHSYPNIEGFYSEAMRVLKPGGHFLCADVLSVQCWKECAALLEAVGFTVEREQDVTTNVLLSCDEIASTRIHAFNHQRDTQIVEEFLALPGSEVYEDMWHRRCTYKILKLKKSATRKG
jgi:ubiquinone/menaquinone biosynthesis C-methylase UbiE